MTTPKVKPSARDVAQLWTLARLLINEQQIAAATRCLELCVAASPSAEIALQANVLLAECCLALCQTESKETHRERWWKRYNCAERCVQVATQATATDVAHGWGARLIKCKYNLARFAKTDATTKHRRVLQSLCDGIHWCYKPTDASAECDTLRVYFVAELRSSLVKMHAASMRVGQSPLAAFEENLKFVRTSMPNAVDTLFQTWLIEVSCHVLVMSLRFRAANDAAKALEFADKWFSGQSSVSQSLKQYHLIIKCFSLLRTGATKGMGPLVDELKALRTQEEGVSSVKEFGDGPVLDNIVDALDLEVACRSDCKLAITLSMKAIHSVQANMHIYAAGSDVHTFLTGLLFDMLYIHCDLQRQQCRFFEMGASIAQLLKIFIAYKHHLELTSMAPYYVAQIHTLIAKYAFGIGRQREGDAHVRTAVQHFLPAINADDNAYPLHFLRLWVDLLDATTYCSGAADSAFMSAIEGQSSDVQVIQVCPTAAQLNLAAQILQFPNLRKVVHSAGNVELRAKYDLFLCKWLWATQELRSCGATRGLQSQEALEALRPDMQQLLDESLKLTIAHVKCSEATSEIMALYGSKLVEAGHPENGENTLKDALRISIHAKNILLQVRLLVDVFRVYTHRQLIQAQAMTADNYVKKIQQLHRRISQAQAEHAATATILAWSSQAL